jgi:hypothetical protein
MAVSLVRWTETSPAKAFAAFAGLHSAVWIALPALLYPNLPLDLIEALVYGREWQLGYDKLPPLPWWLVQMPTRRSATILPTTYWRRLPLSQLLRRDGPWRVR